jgi:hypothetical protein
MLDPCTVTAIGVPGTGAWSLAAACIRRSAAACLKRREGSGSAQTRLTTLHGQGHCRGWGEIEREIGRAGKRGRPP